MLTMRVVSGVLSAGLMAFSTGTVFGQATSTGSGHATSTSSGQAFPDRPVRIVTSSAGGGSDFVARMVAQSITDSIGQPVIVENRPIIAVETAVRALPDGYTLYLDAGSFWIAPLIKPMSYDVERDFLPITVADSSPNILVVHPSVAANSVKELIVLAKSKPGAFNYASFGTGGSSHLAAELLKSMAGVNIVNVPYKGSGLAVVGLIGGEVQLIFATAATVTPHMKSGKLRPLAVSSAQPSALFPGLSTVASSGLAGFEAVTTHAIFAPAKTPDSVIVRLNREIVRALNLPDVKEKFFNAGIEPVGSTPQQLAAAVKSEVARMGKVIKDAGIKAD